MAEKDVKKEVKKAPKKPPFYMMPGKALTSKKGVLATEKGSKIMTEIKPEWVHGGKETLEKFVKTGHIGKA